GGRRVVIAAALLAELLAQRAEDVELVVEVDEALHVALGGRIGLDLRGVDRRLDLQDLALGDADLPIDGLTGGDRVGVAPLREQRRGVERASADDRLAGLRGGGGGERERGGRGEGQDELHERALLARSAMPPAKPSATRATATSTSSAVDGGS